MDDNDNEATNDYSSYWQSIPDPPAASIDDDHYSDTIVSLISKDEDGDNIRNDDVVVGKVNNGEDPNGARKEIPMMTTKKRQRCVPLPCYNKSDGHDEGGDDDEAIVELVRRYCRLPTITAMSDETTNNNNEYVTLGGNNEAARDIESLTGYPMPGTRILPDLTNAINRSAFLRNIQPIIHAMEARKKIDIEDAICATRCEVRKEEDDDVTSVAKKKGSRYCYFDVDIKEKVSTEEYRQRYTAMIIESRRRRCMRVQQQERLQHHYDDDRDEKYWTDTTDDTPSKSIECRGDDDDDDDDGSNMDMDESTNMDDSSTMLLIPAVADNEVVDYADDQKEEDISSRLITNMTSTVTKLDTPSSTSSINTTSTSLSNAGIVPLSSSSTSTNNETLSSSLFHHRNNLPLPSNVADTTAVESNIDPVVVARQRLWHAIDVALANYSREILVIQEEGRSNRELLVND